MKIAMNRRRSVNWGGRGLCLLLVLALLSPVVAGAPSQGAEALARVQPALLQLAAEHPQSAVGIIVQKAAKNKSVEDLVSRLGGTVTKDLSIINAFAAELPGKSVTELARADGVKWVSLDAPVKQATTSSTRVFTTWADDFDFTSQTSRSANFNSTAIPAGSYIWFSSVLTGGTLPKGVATNVQYDHAAIQFAANGLTYNLPVPEARVMYDPAATTATTSYDTVNDLLITRVPLSLASSSVFLTGLLYRTPVALPGGIQGVNWTGRAISDQPNIKITWKWAAAVYTQASANYNALGIKPCDDSAASQYKNTDKAGTPEAYKAYVAAGAMGSGGTNYTGTYVAVGQGVTTKQVFVNWPGIIDSVNGPNQTYGYGSTVPAVILSGFAPEQATGNAISKVEAVLQAYVPTALAASDAVKLTVSVGGVSSSGITVPVSGFNAHVGSANAGPIYVDLTGSRTAWKWADFYNSLQLTLDQTGIASGHNVYYDAIGLRVTSVTGTDTSGGVAPSLYSANPLDTSRLANVFNAATRATDVWNQAPKYDQGQGMTVAVIDSGYYPTPDLTGRVIASVNFNPITSTATDLYGHGTFVMGIIGGNGNQSNGTYMGMAPLVNIVNVRISDDQGMATESDVVNGLQWVLNNSSKYHINVVNMSLNSSVWQSYNTSPMDAAAEILWLNQIVVVVSAGNNGSATLYPPANDPFVITVGAIDDMGTASLWDDTVASFSAYGTDETGGRKPDLVAPGRNIIAALPNNSNLTISVIYPQNRVNANYFRMSGTSMAAPMVAAAAAMVLESQPSLSPDQVKYRLKATANHNWPRYNSTTAGAGYLDSYAAVNGWTTQSANTDLSISKFLFTGIDPANNGQANWGSANWGSANWGSANWGSANWGSANWGSDYWGP